MAAIVGATVSQRRWKVCWTTPRGGRSPDLYMRRGVVSASLYVPFPSTIRSKSCRLGGANCKTASTCRCHSPEPASRPPRPEVTTLMFQIRKNIDNNISERVRMTFMAQNQTSRCPACVPKMPKKFRYQIQHSLSIQGMEGLLARIPGSARAAAILGAICSCLLAAGTVHSAH